MQAPATPSPLFRTLILATLYAIPVLVTVRPIGTPLYDPDIWWHLRIGQWISQHAALPVIDPLAQESRPWVAYSWLYEITLYGLFQAFGLFGIVLYRLALTLAIVAALAALVRRVQPRFLVAASLTGAAILTLAMLFSERPWLFTILFTTLTLHAVLALRQGDPPRWIWTLPLVYLLWANIHIQFIYGLFVLSLACGSPLLDHALGKTQPSGTAAQAGSRRWWALVGLSAACFLATFLNPYHGRLYLVVLEYASQPGPYRWVSELRPPDFTELCHWVMLALTLAAVVVLIWRRPRSCFEVLLLGSTAYFAFRVQRDLWFVTLADLVILGAYGWTAHQETEIVPLRWPQRLALAGGLAGLALFLAIARDLSPAGLQRRIASVFPVEAAALVCERGYRGPLYNDFNWGGYLAWSLPHLGVAIDGRTNLYGDAHLERFGRTWSGLSGWHDDPDLSRAGIIIAPASSPLVPLLEQDSRFVLVHGTAEDVARVFIARRQVSSVQGATAP